MCYNKAMDLYNIPNTFTFFAMSAAKICEY